MSSVMIKDLRKLFKEATGENVHLWCESLSAVMRYDSPECSENLATEGFAEIEAQTNESKNMLAIGFENPTVLVRTLVSKTLKQSVDELVLTKQEFALEALQTAASTDDEEQKVDAISRVNGVANPSIVNAVKQRYAPQSGAIPMLFAVFSRKNDGYGLGG
jgi:hypothetical protein